MQVTSIFSFSQNVFYPFQNKFQHLSHIYFVVCKCFQFDRVQNFVFWQSLFSPFQDFHAYWDSLLYLHVCTKVNIKLRYKQFLLCPQRFLPVRRTFCHFHQIYNCCLQTLSVSRSIKFAVWKMVKSVSLE